MQQLPLPLQPGSGSTFENYYPGPNQLMLDILQSMLSVQGEHQVYLCSATGLGKSHLLQAACKEASSSGLASAYLPLADMEGVMPEILEGIDQLALVAIDDLDQVVGDIEWEMALFDLINRSRTGSVHLLFAAKNSPTELDLKLPDLRSRLAWGPVFNIQPLSDSEKQEALRWRAESRGLELSDAVSDYLVAHFPRSLFALFENIDRLDEASMAQQRRLTIPFIKQVLGDSEQ